MGEMKLCIATFHHEYHAVWPELMDRFEKWIAENNVKVEATKSDPL